MNEYFILIIVGVVVLAITMSLFRSITKAILVAIVAVILFRVGWVYSADELFDKFHLNKVIKEEYQDDVYNKYDEYTNKRDKGIIDTEAIDDEIRDKEEKIRLELEEKINNLKKDE